LNIFLFFGTNCFNRQKIFFWNFRWLWSQISFFITTGESFWGKNKFF